MARLVVGIVGFIVVLGIELHRVKNAELPMLRAIQALGVAIAVFLVVFAALYRSLSQASDVQLQRAPQPHRVASI